MTNFVNISEHFLQKQICRYLLQNGIFFFETDVMDGLKYCHTNQSRMAFIIHHKQMGYQNGQSDMIIIFPKEVFFVELKNGKKGVQSKAQKEFQKKVESFGFEYLIWRNIEDCIEFVKKIKKT